MCLNFSSVGRMLVVDTKAAKPAATRNELADFVLQCLPVPPIEMISVYTDHVTQHLFVTVDSEPVFEAALAALRAGVTWAAAGGALVYGWSTDEALTQVRVSNVPPFLSTDAVVRHMAAFGRIVRSSHGAHRLFPRAADGVIHLLMHLEDADRLPAFLQLVDEGGHLAASLAVHTDGCRCHCYKCGGNHVAMWCRASGRPAGTPPSLWSSFSVTAADATVVPPRSAPLQAAAAAGTPAVPQSLGAAAHPPPPGSSSAAPGGPRGPAAPGRLGCAGCPTPPCCCCGPSGPPAPWCCCPPPSGSFSTAPGGPGGPAAAGRLGCAGKFCLSPLF
jgi:hypothetical protein